MNIDLNTEEIQKAIVDAVVNSTMGETIKEELNKVLTEKIGTYPQHTIFEIAIKQEVNKILNNAIREELEKRREYIKELLTEKMSDETLKTITNAAWDSLMDKIL